MAEKRDYYEILSVSKDASGKVIAESYRKLAMKYHPDRNPGDEEAVLRFKECSEAYEVLRDDEKRARYDRFGHAGLNAGGGGGPQFHDINDIFSAFGDIFGEGGLGDLFGRGRQAGGRSKGANIKCEVTLDLFEAARGVKRTVKFPRHETCKTCSGSGARPGTKPENCQYCGGAGQVLQSNGFLRIQRVCPACSGRGKIVKEACTDCRGAGVKLKNAECEIRIPAGVDNGTRLIVRGEGEPGSEGGPPGDCYVFINVKEHNLFQRDGQHLIVEVPLTYSQAALGAKIKVPTLDGPEDLDVSPGAQPGQVFRMSGRGMPDPRGRSAGDLHVVVRMDVPKKLTKRQEELLRELAKEEESNVSPHQKSFFEKLRDFFVPNEEEAKKEE